MSEEATGAVATWTPDCQGKQDYDAEIVSLSSRYWPRGGGFHTFDSRTGEWAGNDARPEIKPSASSAIMLGEETLIEAEFEGETEAEVKSAVEAWARVQYDKVVSAVRSALAQESRP